MCAPVRFKPSPVESLVPSDTDASYGFVGALGVRWDAGTGLHYMRQRWYDPGLGRFVSRDLLRGHNQYAYTDNQPTSFIDPAGLYKIHPSLLVRARESSSPQFSNIAGFMMKCIARVIEVVQATVRSKGAALWQRQPSYDPLLPPPGPALSAVFQYLDNKIHPEFAIGFIVYPGALAAALPGPKYAEDRKLYGSIAFTDELVRSWERNRCNSQSVDSCAKEVIHEIVHWHLRDIKFPGDMWEENHYIKSAVESILVFPKNDR